MCLKCLKLCLGRKTTQTVSSLHYDSRKKDTWDSALQAKGGKKQAFVENPLNPGLWELNIDHLIWQAQWAALAKAREYWIPWEGYDQNRKNLPLPPFLSPLDLQLEWCVWSGPLCCKHTHTDQKGSRNGQKKWPHSRGACTDGQTKGLGSFDLKIKADGSGD